MKNSNTMSYLFRVIFISNLIGCAHSIDDPMPEPETHSENIFRKSTNDTSTPIECQLQSIEQLEQCKLLTFKCSNSQLDYLLICPIQYSLDGLEEIPEPYVR